MRDLELAVRSNMLQMLERYPVVGWVRPQNIQVLQDEIDSLKAKVTQLQAEIKPKEAEPFLIVPKVAMYENLSFEYRMHVYQDGNFKELKLKGGLLKKLVFTFSLLIIFSSIISSFATFIITKNKVTVDF